MGALVAWLGALIADTSLGGPGIAWIPGAVIGAVGAIAGQRLQRRAGPALAEADQISAEADGEPQDGHHEPVVPHQDIDRTHRTLPQNPPQNATVVEAAYLDTVVHEIRNPLSTIHASLELVLEGFADTEEERRVCLEQARTACHHTMFLVTDLLDVAALAAGTLRIHCERIDPHAALKAVLALTEPLAQARSQTLDMLSWSDIDREDLEHGSVDAGPPTAVDHVWADQNRLTQVLLNLISNAIKFGEPGGAVTVTFEATPLGAVFEVQDQGCGVPEKTRSRLFTRFGRAHEDQGAPSGTGIGLHLCKVLVERMGGSIGYQPGPGDVGSVFWFTLPLATGSNAPAGAASDPGFSPA